MSISVKTQQVAQGCLISFLEIFQSHLVTLLRMSPLEQGLDQMDSEVPSNLNQSYFMKTFHISLSILVVLTDNIQNKLLYCWKQCSSLGNFRMYCKLSLHHYFLVLWRSINCSFFSIQNKVSQIVKKINIYKCVLLLNVSRHFVAFLWYITNCLTSVRKLEDYW